MAQQDIKTMIGNSKVQYGKYNDRVYLMKLSREDFPGIFKTLEELREEHQFTKIFAKIPGWACEEFVHKGYTQEASIPGFYNGKEDVYFMGKFFDEERKNLSPEEDERIKKVIEASKKKQTTEPEIPQLPEEYSFKVATPEMAEEIANVYREVFATYPFPIHDPAYIDKTMHENIVYFCIYNGDQLVAVSSSEMDEPSQNVEMTDFATLPDHRGHGFALFLLHEMHKEMKKRDMTTAYTIARAISFGMNITFAKMGYEFSGTLINNTNISGSIESMNIWHRKL